MPHHRPTPLLVGPIAGTARFSTLAARQADVRLILAEILRIATESTRRSAVRACLPGKFQLDRRVASHKIGIAADTLAAREF
jgi:hypothetical protein